MSSRNIIFRFFGAIWQGVNGLRKLLHLFLLLFIFMLFFMLISTSYSELFVARVSPPLS